MMDDKLYDSFSQQYGKNTTLRWLFVLMNGAILMGWVIGACGISIAWLLLLIAGIAVVWTSNLFHMIEGIKNDEMMRIRRKRALFKDETAEWFNFLINRWWILSSKTIFHILRDRFEPLLNDAKPIFVENVELREFTFGERTPYVKSIKTYDVVDGKRTLCNNQAPKFLKAPQYKIALVVDLYLNSDEFRMLLKIRLFGKGVGMDLDMAMEKLNVCGKLELLFSIDLDSSFPHITDVSVMFIEKPEVWFSIRILKTIQMMEVPLLKTWIHSVFMDTLETALVDPGRLRINVSPTEIHPGTNNWVAAAQGVLTIKVSTSQFVTTNGDAKYIVLKLGNQYYKSAWLSENWTESSSFMVESLKSDKLIIKLKSKRLVSTVTIAQYEMKLSEYNLDNAHTVETSLQKKNSKEYNIPNITVRLEYTFLPAVSLDQLPPSTPDSFFLASKTVSGVITVFIHSAEGLIFSDTSDCNSYCILFSDRRKVFTTQCVVKSMSPQWESRCQILVKDYTRTSLSFIVCCSWNPKKMSNDEMLGVAVFNFIEGETFIKNRPLPLSGSASSTSTINVSIMFQPVRNMSDSIKEKFPSPFSDCHSKSDVSGVRSKRSCSSLMQQARQFLGRGEQEYQSGLSVSQILANGLGLMEITLLQARNLAAMDKNGFSDPYYELKVNGKCKYKSTVRKKTLNPFWEENTIMEIPRLGETFDVFVWDHDLVGKNDFLGYVSLSVDEIRQTSLSDSPKWFSLRGVPSGAIELKVRIISEDMTDVNEKTKNIPNHNLDRQRSERSLVRLDVHIPPPTLPVSHPKNVTQTLIEQVNRNFGNSLSKFGCDNSDTSTHSSVQSLQYSDSRITIAEDSSSLSRTSSRDGSRSTIMKEHKTSSPIQVTSSNFSPNEFVKKRHSDAEANAFKFVREKVSRSLRLRRFKSEVNVRHENKYSKRSKDSNEIDFFEKEPLSHSISQPNIRNDKGQLVKSTDSNTSPLNRPDKYSGVEGRVLQAQGLHVAHVAQLYCRIKLIGAQTNEKTSKLGHSSYGKTLAKSQLLPAVPNPQFDLAFQISSPECVPRQALLLFEIRSSGKEIVALRRITLQDLLSAEGMETHTWLALNNGASLEITIAHGRELRKQSKKLFRSWSIHKIGKI